MSLRHERDDMDRMFEAFRLATDGYAPGGSQAPSPLSDGEVDLAMAHILRRLGRDPDALADAHVPPPTAVNTTVVRSRRWWVGLAAGLVISLISCIWAFWFVMRPVHDQGAPPEPRGGFVASDPAHVGKTPTSEDESMSGPDRIVSRQADPTPDDVHPSEGPLHEAITESRVDSGPIPATDGTVNSLGDGLLAHDDTEVQIEGEAALLTAGLLTFVRKDKTRPRVDEVRWHSLPLVARPIGTVFISGAHDDLAVVGVREGQVNLLHRDGTLIDSLMAGEIAIAAPDVDSPGGIRIRSVTSVAIGSIPELLPASSETAVQALGQLVVRVRIAMLPSPVLESLQELDGG